MWRDLAATKDYCYHCVNGSCRYQADGTCRRKHEKQAFYRELLRRIQNAGLSAGWSAWHEQWAEAAAQKRMLAGAAARLVRPQLAACAAH